VPQILQVLQEIWVREHPQREFPMVRLATLRRMVDRWGRSWRRAHKRRRPDVGPEKAILFVFQILYQLADGVEPADIVDADETAFLLYPEGSYTWARRGREAVQFTWQETRRSRTPSWLPSQWRAGHFRCSRLSKARQRWPRGGGIWILRDHMRRRTVPLGGCQSLRCWIGCGSCETCPSSSSTVAPPT
jgi:hypothetical protein